MCMFTCSVSGHIYWAANQCKESTSSSKMIRTELYCDASIGADGRCWQDVSTVFLDEGSSINLNLIKTGPTSMTFNIKTFKCEGDGFSISWLEMPYLQKVKNNIILNLKDLCITCSKLFG